MNVLWTGPEILVCWPDKIFVLVPQLAVVHMSDQYTRISCGGSPLDKDGPVVGLLFGCNDDKGNLQIRDADDIPIEISETSEVQIGLHKAVFPQHSVVGWYRASATEDEPSPDDLRVTEKLKQHYAADSVFCFCLLHVKKKSDDKAQSTMSKEYPVNLYEIHTVGNKAVLLGMTNWRLETSEPERIAVECVMNDQQSQAEGSGTSSTYVADAKSIQGSLAGMRERIQVLTGFLESTQKKEIPVNHNLLRQVQALTYSLGPLGCVASEAASSSTLDEAQLLSHLAVVAKTVSAVQTYTDKFRVIHENRSLGKEMRRAF